MAVKIRLKRMGAKQKPFYRLVVADARTKREGISIAELGTYNPLVDPAEIKVDQEKTIEWLQKGALPTDTARSVLSKAGVMKAFHESKKGNK